MVEAAGGDGLQHSAVHRLGTGSCGKDPAELVAEADVPSHDPLQQVAVPASEALQVAQCMSPSHTSIPQHMHVPHVQSHVWPEQEVSQH